MKSIPIPSAGDVIAGQYRLDAMLGRGGFGMVFKALHLEMERPVALKTLLPSAVDSPGAVERFKRESVLASSMNHPNTVTLFDYGQSDEGLLYLVMELLEGRTLKEEIEEEGPLDLARISVIAKQVLESLDHAHGRDIVHLDLKPENIFLSKTPAGGDHVKVLDFGIARMLVDSTSPPEDLSQSMAYGTARYMAPEQLTAEAVGPQTDLYAFGLILYEMMTGAPAFDGRTPFEVVAKQLNEQAPSLEGEIGEAPIGLLYKRATQKAFDERISSANEAIEYLEDSLDASLEAMAHLPPSHAEKVDEGLLDDGWPSFDEDLDSLLTESPLVGADDGELESEHTVMVAAEMSAEEVTSLLLEEGSLGADESAEMEDEPTRVHDGFESGPTEALYMLSDQDLLELEVSGESDLAQKSDAKDVMESEPTRVHFSRSGPLPAVGAEYDNLGLLAQEENGDGTDPGQDAEGEGGPVIKGRDVFFSVGETAGYIGEARGVPGVHRPADVDLVSSEISDRLKKRSQEAAQRRPIQVVSPPSERPVDRTLVGALAFLGLSMIAVLTVLILILALPFLKERSRNAPEAVSVHAEEADAGSARPRLEAGTASGAGTKADSANGSNPSAADAGSDTAAEVGSTDVPVRPLLRITSKPSGAQVLVDGLSQGITPLEIRREEQSGSFEVAIILDLHEERRERVSYTGDMEFNFKLKARPAIKPVAEKPASKPSATKAGKARQRGTKVTRPQARPAKNSAKKKGKKAKKPNPFGKW